MRSWQGASGQAWGGEESGRIPYLAAVLTSARAQSSSWRCTSVSSANTRRRRLAASYANYLVVNGGVIVPSYGDPADTRAAEIIGAAHPGREIVPIDARPLIWQNGSVHCLTMQVPAGALA